jgi:TolB protein
MNLIKGLILILVGIIVCSMQIGNDEKVINSKEKIVEKIVFYSNRSGNAQIYMMNPDGSGLERLTNNKSKDRSPAISPDGTMIVFASDRDGVSRIYIMNIDGSNQHRLTNSDNEEILPSWSPDSKKVFFQVEFKGKNSILCSVNADGSNLMRITDGTVDYSYSNVSPDVKSIVCNDSKFNVFTMSVGGNDLKSISKDGYSRMIPRYSPDGKRIVYGLLIGIPPNHKTEIGIINSDGTNDRQITNNNSVNEFASWSPDGKKIVFQTCRDGNFEIYIMNTDGSKQCRITNDSGFDGAPNWGIVKSDK